jgi:uncharacterized protein involved in exopolysaccharide biosynthesis
MSIEELLIYWRIIKKRLWLIGLLCGATLGTILVISLTADSVYQSSIKFQVTAPPPEDVSLYKGYSTGKTREEIAITRGNFVNVLTSSAVAWDAVRELGVESQVTGDELKANTLVEDVEDSDLTMITVTAKDPQLAADLLNKLFEMGLRQYGQMLARSATTTREFISSQLETTGLELEQAKEALTTFQIENKVGRLNGAIDSQQDLLRSLRLERDRAWAQGDMERAAQYDKLIAQREVELQNIIHLSVEYEALQTAVDQAEATYSLLLAKETEAKLKENEILQVGFIQALDEARKPSRPISPLRPAIIALGGVVSLTIGIMLAFILEYVEAFQASDRSAADKSEDSTRQVAMMGGERVNV